LRAELLEQSEQVAFGGQDQASVAVERLFEDRQSVKELVELRRLTIGFGGQLNHLRIGLAATKAFLRRGE
jgi:hypothetical protein